LDRTGRGTQTRLYRPFGAETLHPALREGFAISPQAPAMPIMAMIRPANTTRAEAA
jgi:hypothetical protein